MNKFLAFFCVEYAIAGFTGALISILVVRKFVVKEVAIELFIGTILGLFLTPLLDALLIHWREVHLDDSALIGCGMVFGLFGFTITSNIKKYIPEAFRRLVCRIGGKHE